MANRRYSDLAKTVAKLALIVAVIIFANIGVSWLISKLEIQVWPSHLETVDRAVLIAVILYIGLMAIPFLPGMEMGLILMIILGPKGVLVTYVCTLFALTLSFLYGRFFPIRFAVSFLRWLNLIQAAALLKDFDSIPIEKRQEYLVLKSPKKIVPAMLKHRYLALALLFNTPGNSLFGGGGGIAMMAGMSRLYTFPMYILLISVAILPGPILVVLSK